MEPSNRPDGEGWVWCEFAFMGRMVWGWKRSVNTASYAPIAEVKVYGAEAEAQKILKEG